MTSGLAGDSDKFKIIITLRRAQKFGDTGPSGLGHVARRCFGTKWYSDMPWARSTRDGDTGNEGESSFARFFKLDKFEIIITLCRAQKFGDTGPYKNFDFLYNPLVPDFFCNFSQNLLSHFWGR